MTKIAILDADEHRRLRVRSGYGAQYGENVAIVPVLATELRKLAVEYPVFFAKNPETGRFGLVALLGLSAGNNQYLDGEHWFATYVPLHFRRQPFLVAQEGKAPGEGALAIDLDHPRVSDSEGERLFDDAGQPTEFAADARQLVSQLMGGMRPTEKLIETLVELDLIAKAPVETSGEVGGSLAIGGLYSVDEAQLARQKGEVLERLAGAGYLQACYLIAASRENVAKLQLRSPGVNDERGSR